MELGTHCDQIGNITFYIQKVSKFYAEKRISMLTGLKVSSFACKYVFYRPGHNVRRRLHKTEF